MKPLIPIRFAVLWAVGTLLVALATFWAVYLLWPGELELSPQARSGSDLLPQVALNADARSFVTALPVLGQPMPDATSEWVAPRIRIPALAVDSMIVELPLTDSGWQIDGLETRIGHLEHTDAPGGTGNSVFAGHLNLTDNSPGPLANIEQLMPGDLIEVEAGARLYQYQVVGQQRVAEDRLDVLYPTPTPVLTLLTCSRWSWLNGRYTSREVVTAQLVSVLPLP